MREESADHLLPAPRERRQHKRVALVTRARLVTPSGSRVGRCSNVSMGGMAVRSGGPLRIGDTLDVEFDVDRGRVRTKAEIVRRTGDLLGLRFTHLDQVSLLTLMTYVSSN